MRSSYHGVGEEVGTGDESREKEKKRTQKDRSFFQPSGR